MDNILLDKKVCRRARRTRDPRFDGLFYIAVKTTGIYCRPICPVTNIKEENIIYYQTAIEAAEQGYRPCLRCRPDSAPGSPTWMGVDATFNRALSLINEGYLQSGSVEGLAEMLNITDRYLRKLFQDKLGVSPKTYAIYNQCLFAKKLLHETNLSVTSIAMASGFKSLRRFNDAFKKNIEISPRNIRRKRKKDQKLTIRLFYRPPYDWDMIRDFFSHRLIEPLETVGKNHYGRTFQSGNSKGKFIATHNQAKRCFDVEIEIDDLKNLKAVVDNIRRIFDLDAQSEIIDEVLSNALGKKFPFKKGTRLPGIWNSFEAGIRAILGQQISVKAAHKYCTQLIEELGDSVEEKKLFPTALQVSQSDLEFFKMPKAKKETLRRFSLYMADAKNDPNPESWITLKGIGSWTVQYAQMRGESNPDIYMGGDLGVIKMKDKLPKGFSSEKVAPWRSYLTLQLWRQL